MQENFNKPGNVLLNIGCACISDDTFRFTVAMPDIKIYSFECANIWKESNMIDSHHYEFNYIHKAVSYFDGTDNFYTGDYSFDENCWQYSGSFMKWASSDKLREQAVDVISLNTFCQENDILPTFFHIDAEGEEYNILKYLNIKFWPEGIWLEYNEFYRDEKDDFIRFKTLDDLLLSRNYDRIYNDHLDVLYVRSGIKITPYIKYEKNLDFEKNIQSKMKVIRYNLIKGEHWPEINHASELEFLSADIKKECKKFNL